MDLDKMTLDELVVEYSERIGNDIPWRLMYTPDEAYSNALRICIKEGKPFTSEMITGDKDAII